MSLCCRRGHGNPGIIGVIRALVDFQGDQVCCVLCRWSMGHQEPHFLYYAPNGPVSSAALVRSTIRSTTKAFRPSNSTNCVHSLRNRDAEKRVFGSRPRVAPWPQSEMAKSNCMAYTHTL